MPAEDLKVAPTSSRRTSRPRSSTRWASPSTRPARTTSSRSRTSRCSPATSAGPAPASTRSVARTTCRAPATWARCRTSTPATRRSSTPRSARRCRTPGASRTSPGKVGLTITEMMNTLADEPGKVKALYIMGENPMVSDPDLNHVKQAPGEPRLPRRPGHLHDRDGPGSPTSCCPAACFAEKDGTFTNTERRVQLLCARRQSRQDRQSPTGRSSPARQEDGRREGVRLQVAGGDLRGGRQGHPAVRRHDATSGSRSRRLCTGPARRPSTPAPRSCTRRSSATRTAWASSRRSTSSRRQRYPMRSTRSS